MITNRHEQAQRQGDPTSFVFPNPIAFLFPVYWFSILVWRIITEFFVPSISGKRPQATIILDGLVFAESPRIRQGHLLYFVDMYNHKVLVMDLRTRQLINTISFATSKISGLGWLPPPDNRLLVVLMDELKISSHDEKTSETKEYADLSAYAKFRLNDMCVDMRGRAYVGNFGFDLSYLLRMRATTVACCDYPNPTDTAKVFPVQRDMFFPNGTVVTPDGATLIVAETLRATLTAFDIKAADGTLSNRRTWAYIGLPIDGICLDAKGRVWAAVPSIGVMRAQGGAVRVAEGGAIDTVVGFGSNGLKGHGVVACNLYTTNEGVHQLVLLTAYSTDEATVERRGRRNARVAVIDVDCGPALIDAYESYHAGYC